MSKKDGYATISLLDLNEQSELFSEELCYNFIYNTPRAHFHHFEVDDCVAGFSFADDGEAQDFSQQVNNNIPSKQPQQVQHHTPTKRVLSEKQENRRNASMSQYNPPPSFDNPNNPPSNPYYIPSPEPHHHASSPSSSKKKKKKKSPPPQRKEEKKEEEKKEDKRKKSFFSGLSSKFFGKKEEVQIGRPTNFRHESHIGWDPVNGFDIQNIPPAWKELFKKAGVKKSDLQDKDTAKLVFSFSFFFFFCLLFVNLGHGNYCRESWRFKCTTSNERFFKHIDGQLFKRASTTTSTTRKQRPNTSTTSSNRLLF